MIRVGIVGYGNLGRSAEKLVEKDTGMELVKIFTRRDPSSFGSSKFESLDNLLDYREKIDVQILALGSATDIPNLAPKIAENFNTVDAFDTHASIPEYFSKMDSISKENSKVSFISTGWDPGLFSLNRLMAEAILPRGITTTFWGRGVSQGHSDAVRRVPGIKHAVQYTIPREEILEDVKNITTPLKSYETHTREVYVVPEDAADFERITSEIVEMKNYFDQYETTVNFITEEEYFENHRGMPHGGVVVRVGETDDGVKEVIKYGLELDSNPDFTAAVCLASVRAVMAYLNEEKFGAHTILSTPPIYFMGIDEEEAIGKYL